MTLELDLKVYSNFTCRTEGKYSSAKRNRDQSGKIWVALKEWPGISSLTASLGTCTGIMETKIEHVGWGQVLMDFECHMKESELEGSTRGGLNQKMECSRQYHAGGRVSCQGGVSFFFGLFLVFGFCFGHTHGM